MYHLHTYYIPYHNTARKNSKMHPLSPCIYFVYPQLGTNILLSTAMYSNLIFLSAFQTSMNSLALLMFKTDFSMVANYQQIMKV